MENKRYTVIIILSLLLSPFFIRFSAHKISILLPLSIVRFSAYNIPFVDLQVGQVACEVQILGVESDCLFEALHGFVVVLLVAMEQPQNMPTSRTLHIEPQSLDEEQVVKPSNTIRTAVTKTGWQTVAVLLFILSHLAYVTFRFSFRYTSHFLRQFQSLSFSFRTVPTDQRFHRSCFPIFRISLQDRVSHFHRFLVAFFFIQFLIQNKQS